MKVDILSMDSLFKKKSSKREQPVKRLSHVEACKKIITIAKVMQVYPEATTQTRNAMLKTMELFSDMELQNLGLYNMYAVELKKWLDENKLEITLK